MEGKRQDNTLWSAIVVTCQNSNLSHAVQKGLKIVVFPVSARCLLVAEKREEKCQIGKSNIIFNKSKQFCNG